MGKACSRHGEMRIVCNILVGIPRRRWKDNNRTDLRKIGWEGVTQNREQRRALVNTVMNHQVP
jgi:hypothetical protein